MPGPTITRYLEAYGYDAFYQLAHALSENALSAMAGIYARAQVLRIITERTPIEVFTDPTSVGSIERATYQLCEFTRNSVDDLRQFFWPKQPDEEDFHEANRARWAPCDGEAWDAFFAEFVRFTRPRSITIRYLIYQLVELQDVGGVFVKRDGSSQRWTVSDYIPFQAYGRLNTLLQPNLFEAAVLSEEG